MKSAKIVPFPRFTRFASSSLHSSVNASATRPDSKPTQKTTRWHLIVHWPIGLVWLLMGMLWPLLNWLGALDVLFQWLRALHYSNAPLIHATLQAGIHTAGYLLLSAFVYLYRPKF